MKQRSNKKSMLITTIIMVVLLAAAISTATYAWFSSNSTVNATSTTMTAASSSSANIGIGNTQAIASKSSTFTGMPTNIELKVTGTGIPTAPKTEPTVGSTSFTAFTTGFNTSEMDSVGNFINTPVSGGSAAPKTVQAGNKSGLDALNISDTFTDNIWLAGKSTTAMNLEVKVTISDTNDDNTGLRVAIFAGADADSLVYVGTWGDDDATYGVIGSVGNTNQQDMLAYEVSASGANVDLGSIAASEYGAYLCVRVVAWFDGFYLNQGTSGQSVSFAIEFNVK